MRLMRTECGVSGWVEFQWTPWVVLSSSNKQVLSHPPSLPLSLSLYVLDRPCQFPAEFYSTADSQYQYAGLQ